MSGKSKPVVGVIGNAHVVNDRHNVQLVGQRNLRAVAEVAGALPLMFAGTPDITDIDALLGAVDGILLTGARANVHPTHFGVEADPKHEPYDEARDAMALRLIEACVERGMPLFGICRGFQEMNVAFGGSLHPEIRELPGRMNHRMPRLENGEIHPDPNVVFADRHEVRLAPDVTAAGPAHLTHEPAHVFLTGATGFLGKPGYLSRAQVRELSSLGFEIGCHSMTHQYLDDLKQSALRHEISDAGKSLEDLIARKVEHFSCPGGRYSAEALATAKEAGYRSVATSHARANCPATNPFELGRVAIMRDLNRKRFEAICAGDALWKMRFAESTRDIARRLLGNDSYDRLRVRILRGR